MKASFLSFAVIAEMKMFCWDGALICRWALPCRPVTNGLVCAGWNPRVTAAGVINGSQQRQRVVFREQPLCATASTASKEREANNGRALPRWWRLLRPADACKLLVFMVGFMIVFHSASCGYFFCARFPGILDYPRDIYDDLRDIHILRGDCIAPCTL